MGLRMAWNHEAVPSCSDCQTWVYDKDWRRVERPKGKPLKRQPGSHPPCFSCPKSRNGKPNPDADLDGRSYRALAVYYQIKAGMPMPADPVVAWYCGLIRYAEDAAARVRENATATLLAFFRATGQQSR
jgi:hypothetical protein